MNSPDPAVWFPTIRANSGVDVFTQRLCKELIARGYRAEITWLPLRAEYAPWSVPVPRPPAWANIVHVNSWLHPRFLPKHLPVISTVHSCVHDDALTPYKRHAQRLYHTLWIKRVEAANLSRANKVVAVSEYTATQAQKVFGKHDITVIYNGVDTELFHPLERSAPNTPFRLLYVGNWNYLKGVDMLAPIMKELGEGFELWYTADRSNRHESYSLPSNCRCLGRLAGNDLIHAYQNADALIFPSRTEGFGLVAVEAMACGLPVIASHTSSLPEVVRHGESGWLCPVDNVEAFLSAIHEATNELKRYKAIRESARESAQHNFSINISVDNWINLYNCTVSNTSFSQPTNTPRPESELFRQ
ncbi:glycosyltransferase family 4 protein [Hahella sp. SMD15-11]|uniref:Glycosyltransferase family 4 protein n=1 Tax=Thermohahella caldifontis TaxID=3142973 RepID=A0AB39UZR4_9GAMM